MNIIRGMKNYWKWRKIIYYDRWWDHQYLFEILRFKLEDMETNFKAHGHHLNAEKSAHKMRICKLLLDRLIKDDYYDNIFKFYDKKWGYPEMDWIDTKDSELTELKITRKNVITESDKERSAKEFRIKSNMVWKLMEQDVNYLFKLMAKYILNWWD